MSTTNTINFQKQIRNGANFITNLNGNDDWLKTIDVDAIKIRIEDDSSPMHLAFDDFQIEYIKFHKNEKWMQSHGFTCTRLEGDDRPWSEIARQLNKEWRDYINSYREES